MIVASLDVETTKKPICHPWQPGAKLVSVGVKKVTFNGMVEYREWLVYHNEYGAKLDTNWVQEVTFFLNDVDILTGHNAKFDINWMRHHGVQVDHLRVWDTMIAEFMLYGQKKGVPLDLTSCCERWGLPKKFDKVKTYWDAGVETEDIPIKVLMPYMRQDVEITYDLFQKQWERADTNTKLKTLIRIRSDCLKVLSKIECNGMGFDEQVAEDMLVDFTKQLEDVDAKLYKLLKQNINLGSGQELSAALYGGKVKREEYVPIIKDRWVTLKEPYEFTYKSGKKKGTVVTKVKNRRLREIFGGKKKVEKVYNLRGIGFEPLPKSELDTPGYYQTGRNAIKAIVSNNKVTTRHTKQSVKKYLLLRKKIARLVTSLKGKKADAGLLNKIMPDGCVHAQYTNTVAATGRMSSKDPNGQNFSRSKKDPDGFINPMKTAFISRWGKDGRILVVDLAQLEWRVAAWLSQDPVAMQEIINGIDAHADNAINFFGDIKWRQEAKIMTFRLLYGGSAYAFYMDPLMPDFSLAKWNDIVEAYNKKYYVLAKWQERNISDVARQDGWLYSQTGRVYAIPQILDRKSGAMKYSDTCIKNYPVQGAATGDIVPMCMLMIEHRMGNSFPKCLWMGQVHDSVLFDCAYHSDVIDLAKLCIDVFEDMPKIMDSTFGVDFNLPLTGEAEAGPNYGHMTWSMEKESGLWVTKGTL